MKSGIAVQIPGRGDLLLRHLVLDLNGTLTVDGRLPAGVGEQIGALSSLLHITLLTADTLGTAASIAEQLPLDVRHIPAGAESQAKAAVIREFGPERCVAVGNGANDAEMLRLAEVGIAVVQAEGASMSALSSADLVCQSITDALDTLLTTKRLIATLRD